MFGKSRPNHFSLEEMMSAKLTIGFATYADFHGAYFTLQSLRLHHPEAIDECEFVIVDQTPDKHPHAESLKKFVTSWVKPNKTKFIRMLAPAGTSPSRQAVFLSAETDYVLCLDSHVLLAPGAIRRLIDYYNEHPDCRDLLQGPMIYNDLRSLATHMDPGWRAEMYGTWGTDSYFNDVDAPPKEIPMHGLGLFSARQSVWKELGGFNSQFRAFGGEEGYIHEKFRQAGGKVLGLPFLRWLHRFERPDGVKYPLTRRDKVRNYIIGWKEIGWDIDSIKQHFCHELEKPMSERDFESIVKAVDKGIYPPPLVSNKGATKSNNKLIPEGINFDGILNLVKSTPRDLNTHVDTIIGFAKKAKTITAFVKRREWNVILAAGNPKYLTVIQAEQDKMLETHHDKIQAQTGGYRVDYRGVNEFLDIDTIPKTDMLVLDTIHSMAQLRAELIQYGKKVQRFILVRGTGQFGNQAEGAQEPGLFHGIAWWIKNNPEWFIAYHTSEQYGITVLGRLEEDRPKAKIHLWPPGYGPGTELKSLLSEMGIEPPKDCDCNKKAAQMDIWGVVGCKQNFDTIVKWMQEGQTAWGWKDKIKAGSKAIKSGVAFKLNPLNPFPSLIKESIKRAEKKEKQTAK
jgi:hypothetical protein